MYWNAGPLNRRSFFINFQCGGPVLQFIYSSPKSPPEK